MKDGAYVINLDEYESMGTHWIALFVKDNKFGVEHRKQKYNNKYL